MHPDEDPAKQLVVGLQRMERAFTLLSNRLTRIETKLVKSMAQQGLDASGKPLKDTYAPVNDR